MSPMRRRRPPNLHVIAQGVSDRDIAALWRDAETGTAADLLVDRVIGCIATELSTAGLPEAVPTGVEEAIIRVALRGVVVSSLRKNLIRRIIEARESPEQTRRLQLTGEKG